MQLNQRRYYTSSQTLQNERSQIPFCYIVITNAAYVGLPKEVSNQVSGIINFVRNIAGSIFIAVTGTIVTNRSLFHQARNGAWSRSSHCTMFRNRAVDTYRACERSEASNPFVG
jgi:hypothetical protein